MEGRRGYKKRNGELLGMLADKASELFSAKGYHQTTLDDIAEQLGFTKGGVYYYVSSKEALLFAIHERFITEGLRRLETVEAQYHDPMLRLQQLVRAHVSIMHDYRTHIQVFFECLRYLTGENYERMKRERDRYFGIFRRAIEDGIEKGLFRVQNAQLATLYVLGALNFMYTWYQPGRGNQGEVAELFSAMTISALRREGVLPNVPTN